MISKKMWTVFLLGTWLLMEGLICVKSEKVKLLFLKTFIAGYLVVSSHKMWTSLLLKTWLIMEGLFCVRSENVDNFWDFFVLST